VAVEEEERERGENGVYPWAVPTEPQTGTTPAREFFIQAVDSFIHLLSSAPPLAVAGVSLGTAGTIHPPKPHTHTHTHTHTHSLTGFLTTVLSLFISVSLYRPTISV